MVIAVVVPILSHIFLIERASNQRKIGMNYRVFSPIRLYSAHTVVFHTLYGQSTPLDRPRSSAAGLLRSNLASDSVRCKFDCEFVYATLYILDHSTTSVVT